MVGVKSEMWNYLNSLIDPVFFGRFFLYPLSLFSFVCISIVYRYASCDVWHMSKDKRRYTLHIYVPSRYISSRYISSRYISTMYGLFRFVVEQKSVTDST